MDLFTLGANEAILLRAYNVAVGETLGQTHELILTNSRLILQRRGFMGGVKEMRDFELNQIKVVDKKVQAIVGKHKSGKARLEVYFKSGEIQYFAFNTLTRMEANKWANQICKCYAQIQKNEKIANPTPKAIPGTEVVAETLKGTVDTVMTVFEKKTERQAEKAKRTIICPNCGATIEGMNKRTTQCPYCETSHFIKSKPKIGFPHRNK